MRPSRRAPDELRAVTLERGVVKYAEGSCLVKFGDTHVLVTATLEERLPPWLKGQGRGWVTAEYGMLPRATLERTRREAAAGKQGGRTVEIQRLIGRSLRATVDLEALGERQITVDCDVLQADGGTRTASITGAWVALADCLNWMKARNMIKAKVLRDNVAAISCGIYQGTPVLDLDYAEDSEADTDANFVMTGDGRIVEVQGTAEKTPFTQDEFLALMALAKKGVGASGGPAENGGRLSSCTARSPANSSSRPTIPASSPRCANCWRPMASKRFRPASSGLASRKKPARHSRPTRGSRRSPPRRRRSFRPLPMIPASWSRRSTARRESTRRAGPDRTRISTRRWRGSNGCCRSAAPRRRTSARRISFPRSASPGRTIISRRSRRAPTARWSGRRAAPPASAMIPMFLPEGYTRTFGEMTSIEKHGMPPLGLGLSHRARAFVKLAEICLDRR